ncbi:unnamed protein product [Phaedon cochleariae]|uniref:Sarcospan n=1 Tax=Phaedon cochleariae TaxID=80249 RepID=A0A9P0GS24_PHACE|nr:unnamed protein product [Phaedon cochleariae]
MEKFSSSESKTGIDTKIELIPNNQDQFEDESPTRPISSYDNSNSSENRNSTASNNNTPECRFVNSPSQTHCLNTTVPQNITLQDFSGKHAPTRNSLRHSRMIVLNKSGHVVPDGVSLLKYQKLAKWLMIGISLFGFILCTLSLWLLMWSPNIRKRDNPYWSAVPVIFSGFVGIFYLICCLKEHPNWKLGYFSNSVKYISVTSSIMATIASIMVFFFSLIHLIALNVLDCSPPDNLNTTCICRNNSTDQSIFTRSYHYVDLSCMEVNKVLSALIMTICIVNVLIVFLELLYLYLHWLSRNVYVYSKVPTNVGRLKNRRTNS